MPARQTARRSVAAVVAGVLGVFLGMFAGACDEGIEQPAACKRYVACIRALDERMGSVTDLERFEVDGSCWGSQEGATLCERACMRGLEWEVQRSPNPPAACAP